MADAVDVLECKQAADAGSPASNLGDIHPSIDAALQAWLADGTTPSSFDRSYTTSIGSNRIAVVIEYTTA